MTKLTLNSAISNTTVLENDFIDNHMAKANGEYVKVYLLLLRHSSDLSGVPSISFIADQLDMTERDVLRALHYWKKEGLLDYESSHPKDPENMQETVAPDSDTDPNTIAKEETQKSSNIKTFRPQKDREEFKQLLFVAQTYLKKPLTQAELMQINYFYDELSMTTDLIEYLIEYCVDNGHTSMHYMRKVAINWHEQHITTVEEAKASSLAYSKNCYTVMNAFGIKGRAPAASEMQFIRKWNEEYLLSLDLICEACNRTILAIHQPSFEYADSILRSWLSKNVHNLNDVKALDAAHAKNSKNAAKAGNAKNSAVKNSSFNNFSERSYDMDDLEKRLLQ